MGHAELLQALLAERASAEALDRWMAENGLTEREKIGRAHV